MRLPNRVATFFATHRFRPRGLPTLAAIAFVALTLALGNWQRHRAADKEALAAQLAAAAAAPPVDLAAEDADPAQLRFRTVRARGEYDGARQLFIDNKQHAGRVGYDVVAPLKLAGSGRFVLVDRGWIAQGARRGELPAVPPPAGMLTVVGRANLPPRHYLELGDGREAGALWENLDLARVGAATGLELLPVIIEQTDPVAPADGLVRDWPAPDLGVDQNRSYMLQWYSFAALTVVLWLSLNWRARAADAAA
jgi:surfeit locus 1 family protein